MKWFNKLRMRAANFLMPSSESYRAARRSDNHPNWYPPHRSGDAAIRDSWWLMTARVRDDCRNDPMITKTRIMLSALVMGGGILTRADARDAEGSPIDDFNRETNYWYSKWADGEADFHREMDLDSMFKLCFNDEVEVGNSFLIEVQNPENEICPLSYMMIEWEQVAREYDKPGDEFGRGRIENGIEYDMQNRKAWLWLYTEHPFSDLRGGYRLQKVAWDRVIHNYVPTRISAKSGATWFAPLMPNAKDIDWYLSNELASAAVAASYTMVIKSDDAVPNSVAPNTSTLDSMGPSAATGASSEYIEFGQPTTAYIRPEEEAAIVESGRPNRDAEPFVDMMHNRAAMGAGLSMQRLKGDAAGANFASIRAAHEDDHTVMKPVQNHVVMQMVAPVRRRFTQVAVATRRIKSISVQQYRNAKFRYNSLAIVPPAVASSDPVADAEAAQVRVRSGFTSSVYESGRMGFYAKDVIDEQAEINEYAKSKGVILDFSKGQGIPVERSSTERPTEAEKDREAARGKPDAKPNGKPSAPSPSRR